MRLITILLNLLLASSGAWAEWMRIVETDTMVHYLDLSTTRREGDMRRVWQIIDYKQKQKNGSLSTRSREEIDCKDEKFRTLYMSVHTGPMASGDTLGAFNPQSGWVDIPPNTPMEIKLAIVCTQ